jgi:hypothetical protein
VPALAAPGAVSGNVLSDLPPGDSVMHQLASHRVKAGIRPVERILQEFQVFDGAFPGIQTVLDLVIDYLLVGCPEFMHHQHKVYVDQTEILPGIGNVMDLLAV